MQNTLEVIQEYVEIFYEDEENTSLEDFDLSLEDVRYLMKIYGTKCISAAFDLDLNEVTYEKGKEYIEELKQSIE